MGFTVPDAHLLALHAHEGQVDAQGRDHYLAHLRPIDAVTRRPGEPYIAGLIRRSAAQPLGRLVKLADNAHDLATSAERAAVDPDKARSLREGRYRPARRILLAAEAADLGHGRRILV